MTLLFWNIEAFDFYICKFICGIIFSCLSWASDNLFTGKLPEFLGIFAELKDLYVWISLARIHFHLDFIFLFEFNS